MQPATDRDPIDYDARIGGWFDDLGTTDRWFYGDLGGGDIDGPGDGASGVEQAGDEPALETGR